MEVKQLYIKKTYRAMLSLQAQTIFFIFFYLVSNLYYNPTNIFLFTVIKKKNIVSKHQTVKYDMVNEKEKNDIYIKKKRLHN